MSAAVKAEGTGLSLGNGSRKHRRAQACGEEEVEMEMGAEMPGSVHWDFFLKSSGEQILSAKHPDVSKSLPPPFTQSPLFTGRIIVKALRSRKTS